MSRPSRLGLTALAAVVFISLVISQQATAQEDDTLHGRALQGRLNAKAPKPPKSPKLSKAVSVPPPSPSRRSPPPLRRSSPPPVLSTSRCPDAADIVFRHNAYRALHQAQPLVWDDALAAQAQAWAARNAAAGCSLDHDWSVDVGENIFVTTEFPKPDSRCGGAVEAWYAEVNSFKFNTDKLLTVNMGSGAFHFTQLVWNGSTIVGCGVAHADVDVNFGTYTKTGACKVVVCRYLAPGNLATDEDFRRNVFDISRSPKLPPPPKFSKAVSTPTKTPPPSPSRQPPPPLRSPAPPPPQPPTPSIPSRCPDAADIVSRHNAYRALHQAQPLVWDNALAAQAQAWAARNAAAGCALDHDWSANAGENIFLTTEFPKPDSRCGGAVEAWYAEVDSFKFNTDKLLTANMGSDAFHFTQLIWNGSTTIGCGVANADVEIDFGSFTQTGGCKVIVCRYMAPGNVATDEDFRRNVFDIARSPKLPPPPKFSKAVSTPTKRPPPSPSRQPPPPLRSPPPPQRPPPIPSIPSLCPDAADTVSRHNAYRAMHQAQPLVWDDALAARAQAWAMRNAAAGCSLDHDWNVNVGENILVKTEYPKPDSMCAVAVDGWYSEVDSFNFNTDKMRTANLESGTFHFTQLVWNSTTTVGCGVAHADVEVDFGRFTRKGGCKVVVCRYLAPGNVGTDEDFRRNVFDIVKPPPATSARRSPPPRRSSW